MKNQDKIRKQKSEQPVIRETNEYFELIFNASPDAALITRLHDGIVVEANDGFSKLIGFTREEIIGRTTPELNVWKNPEDRQVIIEEVKKNGVCENFETVFERKDGSSLFGLISARTFMLQGHLHVLSITRDITERKLAEQAISESEDKFRSLYSNMAEGSALHALVYNEQGIPEDYRIIEVNPAFEAQLGIAREAVINKTSREAYGVDDPPYLEIYSRVASTGKPEVFETFFPPLGKHFSVSVYCPYPGSFATIFENISDRKKAELALKIVLAKYQGLFDIFPLGITITDAAGNITESNRIAEALLGISREEQEKRKISGKEWQIIRPDGTPMPASEFASVRALEQGRPVTNVEMGLVKDNGQITWINVSATPIPIEGNGVAIIYWDITERKQAEAELKIKNEQLKDLNATKDKFFSIIAHDLISPFNVILGLSETLKNDGRDLDIDSILKYVDIINSSAHNTYRLLENLLDWARMQQGRIPFDPKAIFINGLIESEIENLKNFADQKRISLHNDTKEDIIIHADEKMLSTVFRNLISNAIKFTPKEGKVNIEAHLKSDKVVISVSDTGLGMQEETLENLFKSGSVVTTRGTGNEKGSGLGLLLCKEFVEKHGGTISVKSEPGQGTRFVFTLKLTP